jgi:hypothetical protein
MSLQRIERIDEHPQLEQAIRRAVSLQEDHPDNMFLVVELDGSSQPVVVAHHRNRADIPCFDDAEIEEFDPVVLYQTDEGPFYCG